MGEKSIRSRLRFSSLERCLGLLRLNFPVFERVPSSDPSHSFEHEYNSSSSIKFVLLSSINFCTVGFSPKGKETFIWKLIISSITFASILDWIGIGSKQISPACKCEQREEKLKPHLGKIDLATGQSRWVLLLDE